MRRLANTHGERVPYTGGFVEHYVEPVLLFVRAARIMLGVSRST